MMNKEEIVFQKRLIELSSRAYFKGITMYTDFLNLNELHILHTTPKNLLPSGYKTFGGYESSERQMAVFLPDAFSLSLSEEDTVDFPITVMKIMPLHKRFSESLTHRDYLGALLNLGIKRSKIGDILVGDMESYVFVSKSLDDFIIRELTHIRHTTVSVEYVSQKDFFYEPQFEEIKGTVSSARLDSLLALAFKSSRSKLVGMIEGQQVYVNGKLITNNGYQIRIGDIVSARGKGRFVYRGILSETKKGRYLVSVHRYV